MLTPLVNREATKNLRIRTSCHFSLSSFLQLAIPVRSACDHSKLRLPKCCGTLITVALLDQIEHFETKSRAL
jgi:hypothetical protein